MYDEPESIIPALQHLRFKGNDVIIFHVLDKNEIEFNFGDGIVLLEDAETEEQMPVIPKPSRRLPQTDAPTPRRSARVGRRQPH